MRTKHSLDKLLDTLDDVYVLPLPPDIERSQDPRRLVTWNYRLAPRRPNHNSMTLSDMLYRDIAAHIRGEDVTPASLGLERLHGRILGQTEYQVAPVRTLRERIGRIERKNTLYLHDGQVMKVLTGEGPLRPVALEDGVEHAYGCIAIHMYPSVEAIQEHRSPDRAVSDPNIRHLENLYGRYAYRWDPED